MLVGPGENAGVIDAGDGIAVALRIESHNHPSAVEPYQGAATGVGGILRDIFTMGARPIALMDPLFFGPLDDARSRWLIEGVVSGISGYGNSVGVPTVGGELTFAPCYARNPLVNVLCLGVMPDRAPRARARHRRGQPGRAARVDHRARRHRRGERARLGRLRRRRRRPTTAKRPSVQVGDPFEEKRLIEACLELLDRGLVVGHPGPRRGRPGLRHLGDRGARPAWAWTCDVDAVPRREPGMEPFEVMTSESQERMLAIVTPADRAAVEEVCRRWEVRATVIGTVGTAPGRRRRAPAHPRRRRGGAGRRPRRLAVRRRPPLRPAPVAPPADLERAPAPTTPARSSPAGATPDRVADRRARHAGRHRRGSTASTTTSSS